MNVRIWEKGFTSHLASNLSDHILFPVFLMAWGSGTSCSHLGGWGVEGWRCCVFRHPNPCSCFHWSACMLTPPEACPLTLKPSVPVLPTLWCTLHACPLLHQAHPPSHTFQVTHRGTPLGPNLRSGDTAVEEGEERIESPPGRKAVFSDSPTPGASEIRSPCPLPAVLFKQVTWDMPASPHM